MAKILIISSQVHAELSALQLDYCTKLIKEHAYDYVVQHVAAGSYEIPFIINLYEKLKPFDAYIALGLVLKKDIDHFDYIMSHILYSFSRFSLNNIIVGNGIVSAIDSEGLAQKINSPEACLNGYQSAFNAVHALLKIKKNIFS